MRRPRRYGWNIALACPVSAGSSPASVCDYEYYGAIVYRLGHQVFILRSGVRLPVALPKHVVSQETGRLTVCVAGLQTRGAYGDRK